MTGGNQKVLVDTSVWIDFFREGKDKKLDQLIIEDLICTNDVILTELLPNLRHRKSSQLVESLQAFERKPLVIDWDIIRAYRVLNLVNGVNKVGIPDLIILQQVIEEGYTLYTFDKHFYLMQDFLSFKLL